MKVQALNALQVSKILFDRAHTLSLSRDAYSSSAALVVLQDAMELVLLACLTELGVDETANLESLSFDQMIGELKKLGIPVPKSGTLKAMNKQRVIVKHYGQMSDSTSTATYVDVCKASTDSILRAVVGKSMAEIHISELLEGASSRPFIDKAVEYIESEKYWMALVEIRKAIFTEVEVEYVIDGFQDHNRPRGLLGLGMRGWHAPWHTRSAEWIGQNVKSVFDYVQFDHERLKLDLLEWGVPTEDFWNVWRLTPNVYQPEQSSVWVVEKDWRHVSYAPTAENAKFCLDRAINVIAGKRRHLQSARSLEWGVRLRVEVVRETQLYRRADLGSTSTQVLNPGSLLNADGVVVGFDLETEFVHIAHMEADPFSFLSGYALLSDCRLVTE